MEDTTLMQPDSPAGSQSQSANPRKRRNPNACELCRSKKVKCDSAVVPGGRCTECVASNWECVRRVKTTLSSSSPSAPASSPRMPSASSSSATGLRNVSAIAGLLHPLIEEVINLLPEAIAPSATLALSRLSTYIATLERENAELKVIPPKTSSTTTSDSVFVNPTSEDSISSTTEAQLTPAQGFELETSCPPNETRLTVEPLNVRPGLASTRALARVALKIAQGASRDLEMVFDLRNIRRPTYWSILPWETELDRELSLHEFPPPDLLKDLIEVYFREVNNLLPLLHKPIFLRSIRENLHILSPPFGETVLLVCAIASRWSKDPRVLLEGDNVGHSAGWRWFRQVRQFKREAYSAKPMVYELQSNILSAIYVTGSSQPQLAWVILGLGVRFAIKAGAHRRDGEVHRTPESELWRRAFWIIWCYDGLLSSFMGRPRAILSDDIDLDLPIECDDEYWEIPNAEYAFKQPLHKPSNLSALVSFIRLVKISEYAQLNLFSVRAAEQIAAGKRNAQDIVACIDSELNRWHDSVPHHLRWDTYHSLDHDAYLKLEPATAAFYRQATALQGMFYYIQVLSHRPFILTSNPDSPMFSSSWALCTSAARGCLKTLRVYQSFITVHFTTVVASAIILLEKWKSGKQSSELGPSSTARKSVAECLDCLTGYEVKWIGAGKLGDVLRELLYLDDLISNPGATPPVRTMPQTPAPTPDLRPEDIFNTSNTSDDYLPPGEMDFLGRAFFQGAGDEAFLNSFLTGSSK